jgi:uncharacterized membrane protein YGL010W
MKDQLPKEEIQKLFEFVESKNVPYRDVQFEIVDHLATAMEEMKEVHPEWSYKSCLKKIYSKFPITGFALLQLEKEKAVERYWRKKMIPYIKEFFKLPKVILTVAVFLIFQQLVSMIGTVDFTFAKYFLQNTILYVFIFICGMYELHRWYWSKNNNKTEEYLFIKAYTKSSNFLFSILWGTPFIIVYIKIMIEGYIVDFSGINSYFIALLVTILLAIFYLKNYIFKDLLLQEAQQKYGHLSLSPSSIEKAEYYYKINSGGDTIWVV